MSVRLPYRLAGSDLAVTTMKPSARWTPRSACRPTHVPAAAKENAGSAFSWNSGPLKAEVRLEHRSETVCDTATKNTRVSWVGGTAFDSINWRLKPNTTFVRGVSASTSRSVHETSRV